MAESAAGVKKVRTDPFAIDRHTLRVRLRYGGIGKAWPKVQARFTVRYLYFSESVRSRFILTDVASFVQCRS